MNISIKYALMMKMKPYSVLQILLEDLVLKTAFKKRRTFNVLTVGNISVRSLHTAEQLISHPWTMSPLKLTICSRTNYYWSFNKNTSPQKKNFKKNGTPPVPLSGGFDLALILMHLINSSWILHLLKHIKLYIIYHAA